MNFFKRATESIVSDVKAKRARGLEKRRILGLLDFKDLKLIANSYGVSIPTPYDYDAITGKKTKRSVGRKDYERAILKEMNLAQIQAYCKKKKLSIGDE